MCESRKYAVGTRAHPVYHGPSFRLSVIVVNIFNAACIYTHTHTQPPKDPRDLTTPEFSSLHTRMPMTLQSESSNQNGKNGNNLNMEK